MTRWSGQHGIRPRGSWVGSVRVGRVGHVGGETGYKSAMFAVCVIHLRPCPIVSVTCEWLLRSRSATLTFDPRDSTSFTSLAGNLTFTLEILHKETCLPKVTSEMRETDRFVLAKKERKRSKGTGLEVLV